MNGPPATHTLPPDTLSDALIHRTPSGSLPAVEIPAEPSRLRAHRNFHAVHYVHRMKTDRSSHKHVYAFVQDVRLLPPGSLTRNFIPVTLNEVAPSHVRPFRSTLKLKHKIYVPWALPP